MRDIGANAYRFSISWPRIFPDGAGKPNPEGLDFYSRLVDALLAAGIEPFATLYHWDLPQALQDRGGWQSRDTAEAFGDYAGHVAAALSDRVKHFFTLNEFQNFVDMGHRGVDLVVQGKPVSIELAPQGTKAGPAEVLFMAVPVIDTPEHVAAAESATRELNAKYLNVMLTGKYTDTYLESAGKDAPKFTDDDLRIIASPLDFVGVNIYVPKMYVMASGDKPGDQAVPMNVSHPKMFSSWHTFSPEVLYWGPRLVNSLWQPKEIYIPENGCAASDKIAPDDNFYDADRVMYLRNVMAQLQRATAEGVPVKGNFVWSAMDNLEWTDGYGTRFGLVHVDFETQVRTPKLSAKWFKEAARRNEVV